MTKVCSRCNCTKSLDCFNVQKTTNDGLRPWCKVCVSEYNKTWSDNNIEKKRNQTQAWRKANSERMKQTLKAYYQANKEIITAQNKQWSDEHPNKVKKAKAEWVERNIDYVRAKGREYWKKNPEQARIIVQNRRARRLSSGTKLSYGITTLIKSEQGCKCPGCLADLSTVKVHIDHFMPLILGGKHEDSNIQLLCASCNLKKSRKHPILWLETIVL